MVVALPVRFVLRLIVLGVGRLPRRTSAWLLVRLLIWLLPAVAGARLVLLAVEEQLEHAPEGAERVNGLPRGQRSQ